MPKAWETSVIYAGPATKLTSLARKASVAQLSAVVSKIGPLAPEVA